MYTGLTKVCAHPVNNPKMKKSELLKCVAEVHMSMVFPHTHTPKSPIWELIYFCRGGNTIWWLWKLNTTSTSTSISTNSTWWKASWVGGQPNRVGKVKSIWWTRLWLLKVKLSSPTRFPPLLRIATQIRSSYGPPYKFTTINNHQIFYSL